MKQITITINKESHTISLRTPMAGELRGIKLLDIMQMDTAAHAILIPRISELVAEEFYQLSPPDLLKVMTEVIDFFVESDSLTT